MTQVCWHHPYTISREWCPSDGWSWCLAPELCLACLQQVLSTCAVITYKAQQLHLPLADIWGHWLQMALQIQGWAESGSFVLHPASSCLHTPSTCCLRFPPSPTLSCIYSQTQLVNTGLKGTHCDRYLRPLQEDSVFAPTGLEGLL